MFLHTNPSQTGYTRDGQQKAGGPFLLLFSTGYPLTPETSYTIAGEDGGKARQLPIVKAAVRSVRMSQCGHWMMGDAQLGSHRVGVSGAYGADGLTIDADRYPGLWDRLIEVPQDLTTKFWNGGGHNTSGAEGPDMRAWAIANLAELRKAGR